MVVVEVRQGTLRMDGSDWGPAPNNVDRRSQLDEEEEDEEEKEKEKEEEKQEDEEEERKATDIKSNNPHLAGGEKTYSKKPRWYTPCCPAWSRVCPGKDAQYSTDLAVQHNEDGTGFRYGCVWK